MSILRSCFGKKARAKQEARGIPEDRSKKDSSPSAHRSSSPKLSPNPSIEIKYPARIDLPSAEKQETPRFSRKIAPPSSQPVKSTKPVNSLGTVNTSPMTSPPYASMGVDDVPAHHRCEGSYSSWGGGGDSGGGSYGGGGDSGGGSSGGGGGGSGGY